MLDLIHLYHVYENRVTDKQNNQKRKDCDEHDKSA